VYRLSFGRKAYSPRRQGKECKIYFNFERDILYLNFGPENLSIAAEVEDTFLMFQSMVEQTENIEHVQSMALRGTGGITMALFIPHLGMEDVLAKFTGLMNIYATVAQLFANERLRNLQLITATEEVMATLDAQTIVLMLKQLTGLDWKIARLANAKET